MGQVKKEISKITANTVDQAMTSSPKTVNPETSIEEAATIMVEKNIHTLPVVKDDQLVGIVGKEDILRTLMSQH